jgi:long-chain acyl-CoA synthetase
MAGATVVNFSPLYNTRELEAQVADSGTRLLVTANLSRMLPTAIEVLNHSLLEHLVVVDFAGQLPRWKGLAFRLINHRDLSAIPQAPNITAWDQFIRTGALQPVPLDPCDDLALLQYTGGTTGTPKGAMLTHQNLTANARQIAAIDPHAGERDVIIGALPFFHVFANTGVLNRTITNGGCIALLPRFEPAQVFATIRRTQPTSLPGVPTMFQAMLDDPRFNPADFACLRVCIAGGAPLPIPLKQRWEAATGVRLVEGYGLTESAGVVTANAYEGEDRIGTIGQPFPATRVRLLDREDPSRDAAPDQPGEIAVIGPQIMRGYWQRPEAAAVAFALRDGVPWLRTGDVGVFESDGYLRVVDRLKDMISVGGFKVFPSQVEQVLLQNPAVKEVLVIGLPDTLMGEVPRAFVTLNSGQSARGADLAQWLNARVGKHERVDSVVVRDSLPKTMIGKLDRKALREEVTLSA